MKMSKTFDQWAMDPACLRDKGLAGLMKQMQTLKAEKQNVERWAEKLDVKTGTTAPKKKFRKK